MFCAPRDSNAIFDADRAAMGLDDLLGNRQTKTRILPEALFRPIGVESLENLIERFGPDARSIIVDQNFDFASEPAARNAHGAAGWRERACIVDQIADDLSEPGVMARYLEIRQRAAFERQASR